MVRTVNFAGRSVCVRYPPSLRLLTRALFGGNAVTGAIEGTPSISVEEGDSGSFELTAADGAVLTNVHESHLSKQLMKAVIRALACQLTDTVALRGGLLSGNDASVLVAGRPRSGGPILAASMAAHGYTLHTGDMVALTGAASEPATFGCPLIFRPDALSLLRQNGIVADAEQHLQDFGIRGMLQPAEYTIRTEPGPISAILFPEFQEGAKLELKSLAGAEAAMRLLASVLNAPNIDGGGIEVLSNLARRTPAVEVRFGGLSNLDDVLDNLIRQMSQPELDVTAWHRLLSRFAGPAAPAKMDADRSPPRKINPPTGRRSRVPLTIGMATYDDFDGVFFTIQALRLNNRKLEGKLEFLVVDNHPDGPCGNALKKMEAISPNYRYVPFQGHSGTAVRDRVFAEATGDYVMCLDCHVLLEPDALGRLLDYLDAHPGTTDLLQGPLIDDSLNLRGTHFEPVWQNGLYGQWAMDPRGEDPDADPFDIPSQGLGLFVSRRETWPGFNLKFRGFGGEEGYIHEKFRRRGDRTLCLPFLRWLHRFRRPHGVPYKITWDDRIRNYMIGFRELGLDEQPITDHFAEMIGKEHCGRIVGAVQRELDGPFNFFDAIRLINLDSRPDRLETMNRRCRLLGIDRLVNRFSAIETPENHHVGCALSHREIIEDARRRGLQNVLVIEDDAIFHRQAAEQLRHVLQQLKTMHWHLLYLGGWVWNEEGNLVGDHGHLRRAHHLTCSHAIAYNKSVFDIILEELPPDEAGMSRWTKDHVAIDQYLARLGADKFVTEPMLAMQVELFGQTKQISRDQYNP